MATWTCIFCEATQNVDESQINANRACETCGMESSGDSPGVVRASKPAPKLRSAIPVVNTESIQLAGMEFDRHLPMVCARRVYGINAAAELLVGLTDAFGGRSNRMEVAAANIERELVSEIRAQAARAGADAVICFRVQFGNLSGGDSHMLYGFAQGTPVKLKPIHVGAPEATP